MPYTMWEAFSRAVREEEARLHALCRADTTMEQITVYLATLARAARQHIVAAVGAAQPVPLQMGVLCIICISP